MLRAVCLLLIMNAVALVADAHITYFVDYRVSQSGNGLTWVSAFKTIQEAINASDGDDTVFIAPGVYPGPIDMNKGVLLFGGIVQGRQRLFFRRPLINQVIIDGRGSSRPLKMGPGTEINGLWIINGRGDATGGGGILVTGNAVINGCVFANCSATGPGAALHVAAGGRLKLENSVFYNNGPGPTVEATGWLDLIVNNLFSLGQDAVRLTGSTLPTFVNNVFYRNIGRGIDVVPATVVPTIEHNHFEQNAAPFRQNRVDVVSVSALNALAFAANNQDGDPRFVHEAIRDFRLRSDSPLIDTGKADPRFNFWDIDVLQRPFDDPRVFGAASPRDIGPHEWMGTSIRRTATVTPGATVTLDYAAPLDPNKAYAAAASFGTGPLVIGLNNLYLALDSLLFASVTGALPGVFPNFAGRLDASGVAQAQIRLPNLAALRGVTVYTAMAVLNPASPGGVKRVSRTLDLAIQ